MHYHTNEHSIAQSIPAESLSICEEVVTLSTVIWGNSYGIIQNKKCNDLSLFVGQYIDSEEEGHCTTEHELIFSQHYATKARLELEAYVYTNIVN